MFKPAVYIPCDVNSAVPFRCLAPGGINSSSCVALGASLQQGGLKCVASGALLKLEMRHSSDIQWNELTKHLVMRG
jgi:hypothetical protein